MPRQDGRRAIITGGNSGIGFAAALELARHGAAVVLACRSRAKGEEAALRLNNEVPGSHIDVDLLDLSSLASVRAFAERELARPEPLDLLINNAGVFRPPTRHTTADGFELQFGVNVLSHFALTGHLLPKLQTRGEQVQSTGGLVAGKHDLPRIVTLASVAHKRAHIHLDDLQSERVYSSAAAYGQSKLANLMLAFELDRRLRSHQLPVLSVAAHPGIANTNLFHSSVHPTAQLRLRALIGRLIEFVMNSSDHGALPTLFAAASPEAVPGGYYGPPSLFETRGASVVPARVSQEARNQPDAQRLWTLCEQLTATRYLD